MKVIHHQHMQFKGFTRTLNRLRFLCDLRLWQLKHTAFL